MGTSTMTSSPETPEPATEEPVASAPGCVLRGTTVAGGFASGPARCSRQDLNLVPVRRIPSTGAEAELNRFHSALARAREGLEAQKGSADGESSASRSRVIENHHALLSDSVFLSDVENLILGEQFALESAVAKVVLDFDRIFRIVQNETLQERAVDLRDVGLRVLRALSKGDKSEHNSIETLDLTGCILVAPELTIVDLLASGGSRPRGIVTAAGSMAGRATLLARSLGIPTLVGVEGLLEAVQDGDALLLDASEGALHVRPAPEILQQFREAEEGGPLPEQPAWAEGPVHSFDGTRIHLAASGGSLPEIQRARSLGFPSIGLFRTEVLFLLEDELPGLDTLTEHYRALLSEAGPIPVSLRLLDLNSALAPAWMNTGHEANPAMGLAGVRLLLERGSILRRQLRAVLCAAADHPAQVEVMIPLLVDCGELRAIKEAIFEERYELRRKGIAHCNDLAVGIVIETPAAVIGVKDLVHEASSVLLAVDSLQQYLLATDRDHVTLAAGLEHLHPFLLRAVAMVQDACLDAGISLRVWGHSLAEQESLGLLLGLGLTHLVIPPAACETVVASIRSCDLETQRLDTQRACSQSTAPHQAPPPPDVR